MSRPRLVVSLSNIYIFASWMSNRNENTFRKLCGKEKKKKEKYMRYRSTEKSHTCKLSEREKKKTVEHTHTAVHIRVFRGEKKRKETKMRKKERKEKTFDLFFFLAPTTEKRL